MHRGDVPDEVLRFIERRIDSVPHLEALLLLWENPAVAWSDADLARRVYVSADRALRILSDLARSRLIVASSEFPGSYQFDPAWDADNLMQRVASSYSRHLVHVARLIHAKGTSEAVRDFARAFEFKSED